MAVITVSSIPYAQADRTSIEETVDQFVKATIDHNLFAMNNLLHEKFQTFQGAGFFSKSVWMKLLGREKTGEPDEKGEALILHIAENSASIKIRMSGKKGKTELFVHLTKNDLGAWQILHILPFNSIKV